MRYIAHIEGDRKQSVLEHLENTASLAYLNGSKFGAGELLKLAGLLHDMGKLCDDFTEYILGSSRFSRGDIDHCYAGAKYILDVAACSGKRDAENAAELIARIILSHHGLHDWLDVNCEDYLQKRCSKNERYDEIVCAYEALIPKKRIEGLLSSAANELALLKQKLVPLLNKISDRMLRITHIGFYMGILERLALSALIDADRADTAAFMAGIPLEPPMPQQDVWSAPCDKMEAMCAVFSKRTDKISMCRTDISDRCAEFAKHKVGVCRLIVPTGGGKTLSSLRFAIEQCKRFDMQRILYVAPYMSIIEQNSDIIKGVVGDELFFEHHSNFYSELVDEDEVDKYTLLSERWSSPVIATTLVQLLNTLFLGKTASVRRLHQLCGSVIIIDEVQSVPMRCTHIFNLAVNFLSRVCGAAVVLCSATQPPFENDDKFPVMLDMQSSMTGDCAADFASFKRTQLINRVTAKGYTYSEAAALCCEKFALEGDLLLIVNTKSAAEEMYRLLAERCDDAEVIHLSTKMCPEHRRDIIRKMTELLAAKKPVICVTTQLIEAGVDISFKCVVRSLAGLDNAAQAAGRCNRHGEHPCKKAYIINITDERLGKLAEIRSAQNATRQTLYAADELDLLSVATMERYYSHLFRERSGELSYPAEDNGQKTSLVDMLSVSTRRRVGGRADKLYQCFRSAGAIFEVIDSRTRSVLVPYNEEAKRIISDLNSDIDPARFAELLRSAQKYMVSLYLSDERLLQDIGALFQLKSGDIAVCEEYYSARLGITHEAANMEFLAF